MARQLQRWRDRDGQLEASRRTYDGNGAIGAGPTTLVQCWLLNVSETGAPLPFDERDRVVRTLIYKVYEQTGERRMLLRHRLTVTFETPHFLPNQDAARLFAWPTPTDVLVDERRGRLYVFCSATRTLIGVERYAERAEARLAFVAVNPLPDSFGVNGGELRPDMVCSVAHDRFSDVIVVLLRAYGTWFFISSFHSTATGKRLAQRDVSALVRGTGAERPSAAAQQRNDVPTVVLQHHAPRADDSSLDLVVVGRPSRQPFLVCSMPFPIPTEMSSTSDPEYRYLLQETVDHRLQTTFAGAELQSLANLQAADQTLPGVAVAALSPEFVCLAFVTAPYSDGPFDMTMLAIERGGSTPPHGGEEVHTLSVNAKSLQRTDHRVLFMPAARALLFYDTAHPPLTVGVAQLWPSLPLVRPAVTHTAQSIVQSLLALEMRQELPPIPSGVRDYIAQLILYQVE